MWVHLNNIASHKLLVRQTDSARHIPDVNYAIVALVCVIVEENVLSRVVGLVEQEKLPEL